MRQINIRLIFILLGCGLCGVATAIPEGPEANTPEWGQREAANFGKVLEAPAEQTNPVFIQRLTEQGIANQQSWLARLADDPSWLDLRSANTQITPLCTSWAAQCSGDPFRYPGVDTFYEDEAEVSPVVFYDRDCARISGRVWQPKGAAGGAGLPAVVIENGSVQAPEPLYWWAAQLLVRAGYVVMTFDPRGQGRSDQQSPAGGQGSNANPEVFWNGLVDAIDFFRSSSVQPYPHNLSCAGTYPTKTTVFNPYVAAIDADRLGIAGHSLGALGVAVVQGYGAEGAEPWPGQIDSTNPVKVAVAWDGLPGGGGAGGAAGVLAELPAPLSELGTALAASDAPPLVPRVPTLGQNSEYGLTPAPFLQPPDIERNIGGYEAYKAAGVPVIEFTIQGSSHYEWSLIPTFPTSSWCPEIVAGRCQGGWGLPMAEHYTLAWFDRWLKAPGESGYADADARLTADQDWVERMSFYFRSARSYTDRDGIDHVCEDIRGSIKDEGAVACSVSTATGGESPGGGNTDGGSDAGTDDDDALFGDGCVMGSSSVFDPLLPFLLLCSIGMIWRRQSRVGAVR